ncbi:MAG: hypothetical protein GXO19_02645 [Epsilonproteobacteria bacterium]|nr:hypothetical protein [Campylobacterota bacterium]NPA56617.1 hypothetical protein [Campylobacterota bacterium]
MANEQHLNEDLENLDDLQQNELDDIVLERYDRREKMKRYALLAGSVLLIFVIVIIIVKIVTDSSTAPQDTLIEEEIVQNEGSSSSDEFEEIPVIPEEDEGDLDKEELNSVIQEVMEKEKSLAEGATEVAAVAPVKEFHREPEPKPAPKPRPKVEVKPKPEPKREVAPRPEPPAVHHSKEAPKPAVSSGGSYYIQVGAFLKQEPDKRFLEKIRSHGFHYEVREFTIDGKRIKRVYIGPFPSRQAAANQLKRVKEQIASGAFITRLSS